MSIAITFGDFEDTSSLSGAIYFNAVVNYGRRYSGRVTEHPLEAGVKVSDHFISDNPIYTIRGVISSVDLSNIPSMAFPDDQPVINNQPQPSAVSTNSAGGGLMKFIPASVTQFIPPNLSINVQMDSTPRESSRDEIESLLKELMGGLFLDEETGKWQNRMTTSKLFMMDGFITSPPIEDLVLTSVNVVEDENSGEELTLELTMEQVRFVTLQDAEAPNPPKPSTTATKTSPTVEKGSQPQNNAGAGNVNPDALPDDLTFVGAMETTNP